MELEPFLSLQFSIDAVRLPDAYHTFQFSSHDYDASFHVHGDLYDYDHGQSDDNDLFHVHVRAYDDDDDDDDRACVHVHVHDLYDCAGVHDDDHVRGLYGCDCAHDYDHDDARVLHDLRVGPLPLSDSLQVQNKQHKTSIFLLLESGQYL